MVNIEELVRVGRARAKAEIGLPPNLTDLDASVLFVIGTRAHFQAEPVVFDRLILTNVIQFDLPPDQQPDQSMGVIEDQLVVRIVLPDIPLSAQAKVVNVVFDVVERLVLVGGWVFSPAITSFVLNEAWNSIRQIRIDRAQSILTKVGPSDRARFRALIRTAKLGRAQTKGLKRSTILFRKVQSPARLVGRAVVRTALKALLFIGLIVDIFFIAQRTTAGAKRGGLAGAVGGLVAGMIDAATLGLIPQTTAKAETNVESFLVAISSSRFFSDAPPVSVGVIG